MTVEKPAVAFLLRQVSVGQEFSSWPSHITIIPPTELPVGQVTDEVHTICARQSPFALCVGEGDHFGVDRSQYGFHLEYSPELQQLHGKLLKALGGSAIIAGGRDEWLGENYSPHITLKSDDTTIKSGLELAIDRLYVVTRQPSSRRVHHIVKLGGVA